MLNMKGLNGTLLIIHMHRNAWQPLHLVCIYNLNHYD